jgi:hypothetical protein
MSFQQKGRVGGDSKQIYVQIWKRILPINLLVLNGLGENPGNTVKEKLETFGICTLHRVYIPLSL